MTRRRDFLQRLLPSLMGLLLIGCEPPSPSAVRRNAPTTEDVWSDEEVGHLSLVEIGERSLDLGERLEDEGLRQGALEAFERAAWAFEYHERLTGESPILLDDVRDSVSRLRRGLTPAPSPRN